MPGDLELSGLSIMLNININIFIKSAFAYKRYWKFEVEHPEEEIDLVYADANHYNLLYKINTKFKLENESEKNNINFKEILQEKIIKEPSIKKIKELNNDNKIHLGSGTYLDCYRKEYKDKYNDIFKYLNDKNFVQEKYSLTKYKGSKNISKKRTKFRKYCKENYFIKNNRLYYK